MADLDFCKLEVIVIHSLQTFTSKATKFQNVAQISQYFKLYNSDSTDIFKYFNTGMQYGSDVNMVIQVQFDNTQLNCELKIVDSAEDASDTFTFKVWNLPENTILAEGDYLLFKYYWEADPSNYISYHGIITTLTSKRTSANLQTTVKGQLVDQNILYNWSVYDKYPKLNYYSDIKDFIEQELQFKLVSRIQGFEDKTKLPTPILTRSKSVGDILNDVCDQITKTKLTGDTCHWKFVNGQDIWLYKHSDLGSRILNEYLKMTVPSVKYNDLLEYTLNDDGVIIQVFGIPTLVAGVVFYIDAEEVPEGHATIASAYYMVNEVEHNITVSDGYVTKIYASLTK